MSDTWQETSKYFLCSHQIQENVRLHLSQMIPAKIWASPLNRTKLPHLVATFRWRVLLTAHHQDQTRALPCVRGEERNSHFIHRQVLLKLAATRGHWRCGVINSSFYSSRPSDSKRICNTVCCIIESPGYAFLSTTAADESLFVNDIEKCCHI